MIIKTMKALLKNRPQRKHIWCLMLINIIAMAAGELAAVLFLFYKLQYKMSTETFGWMMSAWACGTFISQLLVVPFLSMKLKLRYTTLIIMALASNALDYFFGNYYEPGMVPVPLLGCPSDALECHVHYSTLCSFQVGWTNSLGAAPAYNLIYQATLKTHPAIAIYIGVLLFLIGMVLAIYTHIDMKRMENKNKAVTVENKEREAASSSTHL